MVNCGREDSSSGTRGRANAYFKLTRHLGGRAARLNIPYWLRAVEYASVAGPNLRFVTLVYTNAGGLLFRVSADRRRFGVRRSPPY